MSLILPDTVTSERPSYAAGYAKGPGESAHSSLWQGLVGAWVPAFGPTGGTLFDVSAKGQHGVLVNMTPATDWAVDEKGWCLDFDGSNDHVTAPQTITWPFTFSVWIYFPSAGITYGCSLNESSDDNSQYWIGAHDHVSLAKMGFFVRNEGANYVSGATIAAGWHHISGIATSATNRIAFIDGIECAASTDSVAHPAVDTMDLGRLGDNSPSYSASKIAVALLHSRVLTPSEIQHLYVDHLAPFRLRQRTAVSSPAAGGFQAAWAEGINSAIGLGV